jgi:hypothetical protein
MNMKHSVPQASALMIDGCHNPAASKGLFRGGFATDAMRVTILNDAPQSTPSLNRDRLRGDREAGR